MKTATAYPKRPPFFAQKFIRLIAKTCLANEVGPAGCWLLTMIATLEDTKRYSGPITYWNEQLASLIGLGSVAALDRLRKKLIKAGWLGYEPGGKGRAGKYWVIRPETYEHIPDTPFDESSEEWQPKDKRETSEREAKSNRKTIETQPKDKRKECDEHSYPTPTPTPEDPPNPPSGGKPASAGGADEPTAVTTPTPKPKPPATKFDPLAEPLPHGPGFAVAWAEWIVYRRERKLGNTPTSVRKQLADLAAVPEADAVAMVGQSVRNGWQGIFPVKGGHQNRDGPFLSKAEKEIEFMAEQFDSVYGNGPA